MRNRMYGGVRGRKTKVGRQLLRFTPTRFKAVVANGGGGMVMWGIQSENHADRFKVGNHSYF